MYVPGDYSEKIEIPLLPLEEVLAKTRIDAAGKVGKGCDLETHCWAAFQVASFFLDFQKGTRAGQLWERRDLLGALLHDVGKLTPAFQEKIHLALGEVLGLVKGTKGEDHTLSSLAILERKKWHYLAKLVGNHHGWDNSDRLPQEYKAFLGTEAWRAEQDRLVERLCERAGLRPEDWPRSCKPGSAKFRLVQGLTSLADWISSGMDLAAGEAVSEEAIRQAVKNAGFVPFQLREGLSFQEIFGFPPNSVQREMAAQVTPGGIYILETEMGGGKTEAALYLAYQLLTQHRHNGIYFALPTQLTSDKIHERFQKFLQKILAPQASRRALLLHGRAWLQNDLSGAEGEGAIRHQDVDSWFDQRKRGLLAPFAVGTIDQLLMAIINVRYNFMRTLGAAGKVVIIDEIHSYDTYTGTLVQKLIQILREIGCTVILLSATLTSRVRKELLLDSKEPVSEREETAYPLLSLQEGEKIWYAQPEVPPSKKVRVVHSSRLEECLEMVLERAFQGESVLWIENTVAKSQEVFQKLAARVGNEMPVGLVHSRFPTFVRFRNETRWTRLYGKQASQEERSGGKILVGTQVLEQSIDIDADYLITRLCPTDMLLQRIGRLWRHRMLDRWRPEGASCTVVILNEEPFVNQPEKAVSARNSRNSSQRDVYAPYVLMRSQEVWENVSEISIPDDMRTLLEATYQPREESGFYAQLQEELEEVKTNLQYLAKKSQGKTEATKEDKEGLGTRYVEEETVELLLVEAWDSVQGLLKLHGRREPLRIPEKDAGKREKFLVSRILTKHLIRIPEKNAPVYDSFPLSFLSHLLYIGRETYRPVRAAFIDAEGGRLRDFCQQYAKNQKDSCELYYTEEVGFFNRKKE